MTSVKKKQRKPKRKTRVSRPSLAEVKRHIAIMGYLLGCQKARKSISEWLLGPDARSLFDCHSSTDIDAMLQAIKQQYRIGD
jgi:hypothetical protein